MAEPQRPPAIRWSSLPVRLALLIVLLMLGLTLFGEKGVVRLVKMSQERALLAEEVQRLQAENLALQQEIELLRSDRRTLEQRARQELGLVREDEIIYQLPSREGDGAR